MEEEKTPSPIQKNLSVKSLFLTFFKIGIITFGGGYAMISNLREELVENKKWIEDEELIQIIAIAESTPGPIAINAATFIGYKKGGFFGALLSTLGVVLPSLILLYLISLFFDQFMQFQIIQYAFVGIKVAVSILIFRAGYSMLKKMKKTWFHCLLFSLVFLLMIVFDIFSIDFSSIFYILASALLGFIVFSLKTGGKKQ